MTFNGSNHRLGLPTRITYHSPELVKTGTMYSTVSKYAALYTALRVQPNHSEWIQYIYPFGGPLVPYNVAY